EAMTLYEIAASAAFAAVIVGVCALGEHINDPAIIWLVALPICLLVTWTMVQGDAFAGFAKPIIRAIGVLAAAALLNLSAIVQHAMGSMQRLLKGARRWPKIKGVLKPFRGG